MACIQDDVFHKNATLAECAFIQAIRQLLAIAMDFKLHISPSSAPSALSPEQFQANKILELAARARPFGPSVTIGMKRDARDAETKAPLFELRCAVARPDAMEIGEQQTFLG